LLITKGFIMNMQIDKVYLTEDNYFVTSDKEGKEKYKWHETEERMNNGLFVNLSAVQAERIGLNVIRL
jgi:hypothetical protein